MLEYELQRMHREAKKNALLAEAEGRIQARAEKNTQARWIENLMCLDLDNAKAT